MVSHGNLLHNQRLIQTAFGLTERSVAVSWLPLYHDMGLIGHVLQSLYLGATSVLMSPVPSSPSRRVGCRPSPTTGRHPVAGRILRTTCACAGSPPNR